MARTQATTETFRRDLRPDPRADTTTRVSAKPTSRSHSAGLLHSERQLLANPSFNDSDTALSGSAFLQSEAKPQVLSASKDNFRKDDDVRWQWSGTAWTTGGCPQGERGGVHHFGVPPKTAMRDSAIFTTKGTLRVVSAAKDVDFAKVLQAWRNQEVVP